MNLESSSADTKTENGTNASPGCSTSISQDDAKSWGSFPDKESNQQGKGSMPRSPKSRDLPTASARPRNPLDLRPLIPPKPHVLHSGACGTEAKQPSQPLHSQLQSREGFHGKREMTGNTKHKPPKPNKPQPPPKPQHICTSGAHTVTTITLEKEKNEKATTRSYVKWRKQLFEEKRRSLNELSKRSTQLPSEAKQSPMPQHISYAHTENTTTLHSEKTLYISQQRQLYEGRQKLVSQSPGPSKRGFNPTEIKQSPTPQHRSHAHTETTKTLEREHSEQTSYVSQQRRLYEERQRLVAQSPGPSKRGFNPAEIEQSSPLQTRASSVPLPRSPYSAYLVKKKSGASAEPPTFRTLSLSVSLQQNHSISEGNKVPVKQAPATDLCREKGVTYSESQDYQLASSGSTHTTVAESSILVSKRLTTTRHGSERRRFTFNSSSQSLLDRARQLSGNRKWCNQPEVKESLSLPKLNKRDMCLQEAIFEVITSEATYHLNLATLTDVFMDDPKMDPNRPEGEKVMNRTQHSAIFSNVKEIREVSASFLDELQNLMSEDVFLANIFPILEDYAENRFVCYERYCASQKHRLEELENCGKMSENFQRHLQALEMEANQSLQSLLSAPMQRITKLPLLMKEIQKWAPNDHPSHEHMESCHRAVQKVAGLCNKGAGKVGDLVHLDSIWQRLNFDQLKLNRSKPFHFIVPGRQLMKEGFIDRLVLKENSRHSRVKPYKTQLYLFVFTDLLMITSKDKNKHSVVDYCPLAKLTVEDISTVAVDNLECSISNEDSTLSDTEWAVAMAREKHGFLVTLLESVSKQRTSYIFIVKSNNEKTQWIESLSKPSTAEVVIATPKLLDVKKKKAPLKKLWREQPQVLHSGVVQTLTNQKLELQEALFAIIVSEELYLSDLDTLVDHYMCDSGLDPSLPKGQRVLSSQEHHHIFSNIKEIAYTSRGLLKELQHRQMESVLVDSISDILLLCVERMFHHYVQYCTNLPNQLKELENSIETNESFSGYLRQLEEDQPTLRSLLEAPMNRVKELPHLVGVVLEKMQAVVEETEPLKHSVMQSAFRAVEKVERLSVTGQQKIRKLNELSDIQKQLDFGSHKPFTLMTVNRSLVRQGTLAKLEVKRSPFIRTVNVQKKSNYIIVLTDHILITKKKENCYKLIDHSPLNKVQVEPIEAFADLNTSFTGGEDTQASASWAVSKAREDYAFLVTFLELKKSYIFVAENDEQRREWMESLMEQKFQVEEEDTTLKLEYLHVKAVGDYKPQALDGLNLKTGDIVRVYRVTNEWCEGLKLQDLHWGRVPIDRVVQTTQTMGEGRVQECQVEAILDFQARKEDELSLEKGDVVKVSRKMAGWYDGKKLHSRGNLWGWFPENCTKELASL